MTLNDIEWPCNIDTLHVSTYTPGIPNQDYFRSTTSGFRDRAYFHMRDLDVTLAWLWKVKCDFGSIGLLHVCTYTPGIPNRAYFHCATSVFLNKPHLHRMTLNDLEWPCNIDTLHVCTYTPGIPNRGYFCSTTIGFLDRAYFRIRDLDVTLVWPWKIKCDFGSIGLLYVCT